MKVHVQAYRHGKTAMILEAAPLGSRAPSSNGGCWVKVYTGWQWNDGDVFPRPGADWTGLVVWPTAGPAREGSSTPAQSTPARSSALG
jgi:hypothetical protein